jgi:hypothetical protein
MISLALPPIFSTLQIPLLYTINITSLALGPSHPILRSSIHALFILLVLQSLYKPSTGVFGMRYAMECLVWSVTWVYFDWNVLCRPDAEGWEKISYAEEKGVKGGEKKDVGKLDVKEGFWNRMWWAIRLATTQRYVGWSQEVKNVRKEVDASYSRW